MAPTQPTRVLGRRVVAWFIDAALAWAVALGVFFAVAEKVPDGTTSDSDSTASFRLNGESWLLEGGASTAFFAVVLAGWLAYTGVLPGVTGWTVGKRAAGVRLVDAGGVPPGPGPGVVRSLFWFVDGFPYVLPGLVGFIVAASGQRRQRVGDLAAKTFVVRAGQAPESEERPLAADAPPSSAAAGWYADPRGEQRLRYWDGDGWTAHTAP